MVQLEKSLSYPVLLIITINSVIGTGIFFLPAVGAREAGPASLIAWAALAVASIFLAMVFAELTSMFPKAGGIYEFSKQAFGRFPSFIVGWITILAGNITIAMLMVGAIQYLMPMDNSVNLLGLIISASVLKITMCILFILLFNYIAYKGIQTSARMLVVFGIITMSALIVLIIPGIIKFNPSNLSPFFVLAPSGIILAMFLVSETFFGIETSTFLAAETKNGEKVVPKALVVSSIVIAVLAMLFVVTSLSTIGWKTFGQSTAPLTDIAVIHYGGTALIVFTLIVFLSIIGSVAGWIVSSPRLLLAMSEDRLFLGQLKEIHPVHKTPYKAIFFQTALTILLILIGFGSYEMLLVLLIPLEITIYSAVIISLLILRKKMPDYQRHYRMPFAKTISTILILFYLSLVVLWVIFDPSAFSKAMLVLSLVGLGIPLYFLIEVYYDPRAIIKINDKLAYLSMLTENMALPQSVKQKIFQLVGNLHGKTVLEYGCGVGTLTVDIAKKVGHGKVYATDISKTRLDITRARVNKHIKKGHQLNVQIFHDEKQMHRIDSSITYADVVISVGMLSYVQDIDKVLADINTILPEGGEICFVEYGDFFNVLPDVEWLADNKNIEKIFKRAGFSVRVIREEGPFWNYIFVYGMKSKYDIPFI